MTPARRSRNETPRLRSTRSGWQAALIVLAGIITSANSLSSPLMFDDFASIVRNPQITDLSNWSAVLSPQADGPVAGRPLVNLSFAVNLALAGPNVGPFHAVNIALHLICALILFGLVRRTLDLPGVAGRLPWRSDHMALAVALLWTVHPLNSEVVNYTTQRSDSMMAACYLFALYAATRSLERGASSLWAAASVGAVLTGIGCKETIATAPLLIVLYDRAFGFESYAAAFRARWRLYVALAATWVPLGLLVALNGQSFSAGFSSANISVIDYFLNQPRMISQYLWLSVWPQSLVLYYGWTRTATFSEVWPYFVFITSLFAATLALLVRRPQIGFLGAAVFLTLGPTSSVIPIATEVGAERRMYLALGALLVLAVIAAAWALKQLERKAAVPKYTAAVVLAVVSVALAARTVLRNREYASGVTMAQTVLDRWPTPNAHYLLGVELGAAGRGAEAITHLQEASRGYPAALYYLGQELFKAGRFGEAVTALRGFVLAEPRVAAVRPARILAARALEAGNRPSEAAAELTGLLTGSGDADVHALLANLYASQQAFDLAVPHYLAYLQTQQRDGDAWTGLGIAYISLGRQGDAVNAFRNALDAQPGNEQFRANLQRAMGRE